MSSSEELPLIRKSNRQTILSIALAVLVILAVAVVSFLPSGDKQLLHTRGRFHSWGHLLTFTVVGYATGRASRSVRWRMLLFFGSLAFGFGIEFLEHVAFQSPVEWKDVLVDAFGVVGGTLIAMVSTPKLAD